MIEKLEASLENGETSITILVATFMKYEAMAREILELEINDTNNYKFSVFLILG